MEDTILTVKNLNISREGHSIIEDLSFTVSRGDTFAIIGPNGAGKTTLLKAILGLITYTGEIIWKEGLKIGYVPQKFYADSDLPLTTQDFFNLKEKNQQKILEKLEAVGLKEDGIHIKNIRKHILNKKIGYLSGGELQRVIIAWALLGEPDVILFDEPTSGVDIVGEETVYGMLETLRKKMKLSIILISHELEVVRKYTTKVLCLNKEKICFGPPKLVLKEKVIDKLFGEEVHYYHHEHGH